MSLSEKIALIENIINIPSYQLIGIIDNTLIFLSDLDGELNLWTYNIPSKKMYKISSGGVMYAKVSSYSSYIIYSQDVSKGRELSLIHVVKASAPDSGIVLNMSPMRIMGIGFDGEYISFAGVEDNHISIFLGSLDGDVEKLFGVEKFIELTSIESNLISGHGILKDNPRSMELFIYDLDENKFNIYTPGEESVNENPEIKNGNILFSSNWSGEKSLFIYNYRSEELIDAVPKQVIDNHNIYDFESFGWINQDSIWFLGKSNGETKLFIDDELIPTPRGYAEYASFNGEYAYISSSSLSTPSQIYIINMKSGEYSVLVDNPIPKNISEAFSKIEFIKYKSFDNLDIPGYYIESRYEQKPGSSIVYVHGGPWWEVPNKWNYLITSLVSLGYHIIAPNYRGSTGYGEKFRVMDIGDPGGDDLKDIVYAGRWLFSNEIASRKAVFGYSYGGYITYLALTKYSGEWDAGVAGAGIVDWEESYKLSDTLFKNFIQILFDNNKKLFKDRSPIYFTENIESPICMIHPQNDTRTPLKPILHFIERLLELNKSFELHILPDVGHILQTKRDLFKLIYPAIIFLDKVLKN